jgi:hypothetical protein
MPHWELPQPAAYDPGVYIDVGAVFEHVFELAGCDRGYGPPEDRYQPCNLALDRDRAETMCGDFRLMNANDSEEVADFSAIGDVRYTDSGASYWTESDAQPSSCELTVFEGVNASTDVMQSCSLPQPFICRNEGSPSSPARSINSSMSEAQAAAELRATIAEANASGSATLQVDGPVRIDCQQYPEPDRGGFTEALKGDLTIEGVAGTNTTLEAKCTPAPGLRDQHGEYLLVVEAKAVLTVRGIRLDGLSGGANAIDARGLAKIVMEDAVVEDFVGPYSTIRCRTGSFDHDSLDNRCELRRTLFRRNTATSLTSGGGAVAIGRGHGSLVEDCLFEDNTSIGTGGAISFFDGAIGTIRRSGFRGNAASRGGAIGVSEANLASAVTANPHGSDLLDLGVTNSVFLDNDASAGGSVLYLDEANGAVLRFVSIRQNQSGFSGTVLESRTGDLVQLDRTLLEISAPAPNAAACATAIDHNLLRVSDGSCGTASASASSDIYGMGTITAGVFGLAVPAPAGSARDLGGAAGAADQLDFDGTDRSSCTSPLSDLGALEESCP